MDFQEVLERMSEREREKFYLSSTDYASKRLYYNKTRTQKVLPKTTVLAWKDQSIQLILKCNTLWTNVQVANPPGSFTTM